MANTIGNLLVRIGSDIRPMINGLRKAERELMRTGQKLQSLGTSMTIGVSAPLAAMGGAAVRSAAQFEQLEASLATLTGSAEKGAQVFERLKTFAATTPFELDDIVKAEKQLLAFGFSTEHSFKALQYLGDIAAATGGDLGGLTTILGQAKAIGAVYTQDLRQLANRGIPIFDVLKDKLGVTGEELRKMVERGEIDFAILEDAMRSMTERGGLFFNGMKKQSQTTAGAFSNFQDAVNLALADFGKSIMEAFNVRENLVKFSAWIQDLANRFNALSDSKKKFIIVAAAVATAIGPVLLVLGQLVQSYAVVSTAIAVARVKMIAFAAASGSVTGAVKLLSAALLGKLKAAIVGVWAALGPVGIAIGVVSAALAYLYKNSDTARVSMDLLAGAMGSAEQKAVAYGNALGYIMSKVYGSGGGKSSGKPAQMYQVGFELSDSFMTGQVEAMEQGSILLISEEQRKELELQKVRREAAERRKKEQQAHLNELKEQARKEAKELRLAWSEAMKGMGSFGTISMTNTSVLGQIENTGEELPKYSAGIQDFFNRIGANADNATEKIKRMGQSIADGVDRITSGGAKSGFTGLMGVLDELEGKAREFWQKWGEIFTGVNDTISMAFQMREDNLNNYYENERRRIEGSRMSEEAKQKALQNLEEETDKKRRKIARQRAIREKALAIFQATIQTALAVISALKENVFKAIAVGVFGAAQIGLIAGTKIPALAGGGLAYAPTMAMVGDNKNARVDPEVIAPLSKLRDYMGGSQRVEVVGRISGRDILLVQERASQDRVRTRGF